MSRHDVQGRILGMPYDFRRPTWRKVASRMYAPGDSMLVPKVFGVGWTLNLAHRGSHLLIAAAVVSALAAAFVG